MWKKWNSHKFVLVTWRHKYPGESCLDGLHIFCPDYHQMLSGFVSGLATFFFRLVGTGKIFKSSRAKAIRVEDTANRDSFSKRIQKVSGV